VESDLAWALTLTLTSSTIEVVDRQHPNRFSLPARCASGAATSEITSLEW